MNPLFPDRLDLALDRLERQAPQQRIALGLERVRVVFHRLFPPCSGLHAIRCIHVAGTNGKGSTVAFAEGIARAAGRTCLAFASPHLIEFAERFRFNGEPAAEPDIVAALGTVEQARGETMLTWFEHVTLAGFVLAEQYLPDWLICEVGMGGRLDAVNVLDPSVAVITSVGLDHKQWLGATRSVIAREKCGIARPERPVVVAEKRCPEGMLETLEKIRARPWLPGRDFDWRWRSGRLNVRVGERRFDSLVLGLAGRFQAGNAAAAVAAVLALEPDLPVRIVAQGLAGARLRGRFERIADHPAIIVDVAHNPAAARALADQLKTLPGPKVAVFAALADKDIAGIVRPLRDQFQHWYLGALPGPRGLDAAALRARMGKGKSRDKGKGISGLSTDALESTQSVSEAIKLARRRANPDTTIVAFGSFLTAAEAIRTFVASGTD